MRTYSLILCIILFCSCGKNRSTDKDSNLKTYTTTLADECVQKDTITPLGTSIHYQYNNGKFQISWGDNTYTRTYDSIYTCYCDKNTGIWDFVPKYYSETKNYIILTNILWTSSGANPAPLEYSAIVLPKNRKDSVIEKEFFIDSKDDYLIYWEFSNESIEIWNLETKKSQTIQLIPKPIVARAPTLAIQETEIKKDILYLKYESLDKNDEIKIINKKIIIKI